MIANFVRKPDLQQAWFINPLEPLVDYVAKILEPTLERSALGIPETFMRTVSNASTMWMISQ